MEQSHILWEIVASWPKSIRKGQSTEMVQTWTKGVIEDKEYKILWGYIIQCDSLIETRKPSIVLNRDKRKPGFSVLQYLRWQRTRKDWKEQTTVYYEESVCHRGTWGANNQIWEICQRNRNWHEVRALSPTKLLWCSEFCDLYLGVECFPW